MNDPMNGKWSRLDAAPAASAQMIQWYAPETWALIVAEARAAALNEAADAIEAWRDMHARWADRGELTPSGELRAKVRVIAYGRAGRICRDLATQSPDTTDRAVPESAPE